mgnify:FL=1
MENFTDSQLISLYIEGNHKAFDGLINRYAQSLYSFIFNLNNNTEEAKDIVQETFIKAWKNIKKFDHNKNFKTWLYTIGKRTAIDSFRKRKDINFSALDNIETDIDFEQTIADETLLANEIFEQGENIEIVKQALNKISIEDKMIVLLHNGEEMTFEEIAEILDKPMNTIKSSYRRSLITLKEYILNMNAPKH